MTKADDVIAAYRKLTGAAPLLGKWAWGFWQCKERYSTQEEMLGIVSRYRADHMPSMASCRIGSIGSRVAGLA